VIFHERFQSTLVKGGRQSKGQRAPRGGGKIEASLRLRHVALAHSRLPQTSPNSQNKLAVLSRVPWADRHKFATPRPIVRASDMAKRMKAAPPAPIRGRGFDRHKRLITTTVRKFYKERA